MLLLNVKNDKNKYFIEVQNGANAFRSRDMTANEADFYVREVVMSMIASAALVTPALNTAIPEPTVLKKPLKNGVGLTDDHKKLIVVTKGKVEVKDEGPRYIVSNCLKVLVGNAINTGAFLRGEW